jgi:exopolysaccharide production protein ExoQ
MSGTIATVVFALMILGLFWLDRDQNQNSRPSGALWIPVIWWFLACSRSVGQWLQMVSPIESSGQMESSDQLLEGSPMDRLVYTTLLVLGLIVLVNRRKHVMTLLQGNVPIIIFFLYCAVSILWSDYPEVAFKRWNKALGDLVMVLVVLSDREPLVALERLLARTTFLLVPLSILVIKYYPYLGRGIAKWSYKTFYTGVSLNKNGLGMICLVCGLATVWRLLMTYQDRNGIGRTQRLLAHGAILVMVLWLFWLANSMTSLSCFIIGCILLLAVKFRVVEQNPGVVHYLVAAILTITIPVLFFNFSPGILETLGRDPTLTDRTMMWPLLISVSGNHLVGTGYESFWLGPRLQAIWSAYPWQPREAHNGYVEVFLNLGWVGLVLLAVVISTGYRRVFAAFHLNTPIGSLMVAYFISGVIYNFTEAAFFRMMTPVWMFLLLTVIGATVLANHSVRIRSSVGRISDQEMPPSLWWEDGLQQSPEQYPKAAIKIVDKAH